MHPGRPMIQVAGYDEWIEIQHIGHLQVLTHDPPRSAWNPAQIDRLQCHSGPAPGLDHGRTKHTAGDQWYRARHANHPVGYLRSVALLIRSVTWQRVFSAVDEHRERVAALSGYLRQ